MVVKLGGANTFKTDNGATVMNIVTNKLAAKDQVLVAVNAPSGSFTGVQTATAFKQVHVNADQALATGADGKLSSTTEVSNNAPMFGQAELKAPETGKTAYTATVNVAHLTAKITLNDIEVDFDQNGPYKNATFKPTEIYLDRVVDGLNFNPEVGNWFDPSKFTLLTGATGVTGAKTYLTTGTISNVTLSGTGTSTAKKMTTPYYFYVTPSSNATPSGKGGNATRIWIKGLFDPDGDGSTPATTVFYPLLLNVKYAADGSASPAENGTSEYMVYPNKNYTCKITIKGNGIPGSSGSGSGSGSGTGSETGGTGQPSDEHDDFKPVQATITVSVSDWAVVNQETIFN